MVIETMKKKDGFYCEDHHGIVKTQIMLCHTGRSASYYYNGLKHRMDGKYERIPHYMITKDGVVVNLIEPHTTSKFFGDESIDESIIVIVLENLGWLKRNPETNEYNNWIGDIYKGEVFRKKWRGHLFWATYTEEQVDSCAKLIKDLCVDMGIEMDFIGHNVHVDNVSYFEGLVSRSNYNDFWTDVSPAFDFNVLIEKIENGKEK
tara:strand:+ start:945 stop:1559 length:615 start_codon:yes stop_codon:yes gene_type:complete